MRFLYSASELCIGPHQCGTSEMRVARPTGAFATATPPACDGD
jgi:hypothetical protein